MKRSAALAPLSRDHQHALYAALRLRRAEATTLADAVAHFRRFFADEGSKHFEIEEALLLPALPRDDEEWSPGVTRVLEDHRAIRHAAAALETTPTVEMANELGERLNAHIRFEERSLFRLLERRLSPEDLQHLGEAIADAEAS
jgi:Hemerythrin HHE cation binding domain